MELAVLPPFSVLIANVYLQQAGTEYMGPHNLRYHVYFVSDCDRILGAI